MQDDAQAPATKEDIQRLMEQMGRYYDGTEKRIAAMEDRVDAWKEEIKQHFDLTAENMREDFKGAFKDRLEQHADRISRLERHAGIAAA